MIKQHSWIRCREGDSWGYDRRGVWVDRGCSADFLVGKERHDDRSGRKALAAGVAIAGLAVIAAIASSRSSQEAEVASWAVGTFSGYDEFEATDVQVTILPGGSVTGHAGRTEFTGRFKDQRLEAGKHQFRVERSGNGFLATDESNASHRVHFRRSGGGY